MRLLTYVLLLLPFLSAHAHATQAVVVCEPALQAAMSDWVDFRTSQGHQVSFVEPAASAETSAERVQHEFRRIGAASEERCVLLVGDGARHGAPTFDVPALVIDRWGPEQSIATDTPYADTDGDRLSDASVGRLPFDDSAALRTYCQRIIKREQSPLIRENLDLNLVAGVGGFSPLVDAAIEATASALIKRLVPSTASLSLTRLAAGDFAAQAEAWRQLRKPGGVWVYMGHGLRDRLAGLSYLADLSNTADFAGADAAVLIACYAGAFEGPKDCFAERLLYETRGPLVVIAATRVSAPYGNAVLGASLLSQLDSRQATTYGAAMRKGCQLAHQSKSDATLSAIGAVATTLGADAASLSEEVLDHTNMYTLLGDPLLRIAQPAPLRINLPKVIYANSELTLEGESSHDGSLRVELISRLGKRPIAYFDQQVQAGVPFTVRTRVAETIQPGRLLVRATVVGENRLSAAAATTRVTQSTLETAARAPESSLTR